VKSLREVRGHRNICINIRAKVTLNLPQLLIL